MKYSLFVVALIVLTLTACGDPKPAQYPPSLYDQREGMLTDSELEAAQKEGAKKEAAKAAKQSAPAVKADKSDDEGTDD
jgi:predicted small lipoprotein YifL